MPDHFYSLEFDEYLLIRRGYIDKIKEESYLLRFQTALICEALVGKGQGARFVMDSWKIDEPVNDVTPEQLRELMKKKRESNMLKQLKKKNG